MKKLLLGLIIFFGLISSSFATWTIDWSTNFTSHLLTQCDNDPLLIWVTIPNEAYADSNCWFATWEIENYWVWIWIDTPIITECTLTPWNVWQIQFNTVEDMNLLCWPNPTYSWTLTVLDWIASDWIDEAWNISNSNLWVVAITFLAFSLFIILIWLLYTAYNKNLKNKKRNWKTIVAWTKQFRKHAKKIFSKKDIKKLRKKYPKGWF